MKSVCDYLYIIKIYRVITNELYSGFLDQDCSLVKTL